MDIQNAQQWFHTHFSKTLFLRAITVVGLIYALLIIVAILSTKTVFERQQERLATKTVLIEHKKDRLVFEAEEIKAGFEYTSLPAAPATGIYERMPNGDIIPAVGKDGLSAFKAYKHPFDVAGATRPYISIGILDIGSSYEASESAIRVMPPEISFVMSPYAIDLQLWVQESRRRGHEVWLEMPMETAEYPRHDPGPHTMLLEANEIDNQRKLRWLLARPQGFVGFVTPTDPIFMNSIEDMRPIFTEVLKRGIGFIDTRRDGALVAENIALGLKGPYANISNYIDKTPNQENIQQQLAKLEETALTRGRASGLIHPLPISYHIVLEWIDTLEAKGIDLAPLSAQSIQ